MKINRYIPLALLLTLGLLLPSTTYAQGNTPIELSITPPVAYIHVQPGQTVNHSITIEYQGRESVMVSPQLVDFTTGEMGQGVVLQPDMTFPYLTQSTRQTLGETFTLEPNTSKKINLSFSPPPGVAEEEYRLSLIFRAQPTVPTPLEGISGQAIAGIASNMIVLVSPQTTPPNQVSIKKILGLPIADSLGKISFQLLAENQGIKANPASGSASIKNWQGKTVADFPIYPDMVLAKNERLLRPAQAATPGAEVSWEATETHDFEYNPLFLFGPYTVEVNLDQGGTTSTVTKTIWSLPISILVAVLGAMMLYFIYWQIRGRYL